MISVILIIIGLLFPHAINLHSPQKLGKLSGSHASFSNCKNDSVELILSTQIWQDKQSDEFFLLVGSDKIVRGILANQGSESYEMDSTVMLSLQTASVVIHLPKEATSGLSQEDFPLERQIRLRHFLMSKLRLKGYKTCTFEEQQTSNGITINMNCLARAGWAEAKTT